MSNDVQEDLEVILRQKESLKVEDITFTFNIGEEGIFEQKTDLIVGELDMISFFMEENNQYELLVKNADTSIIYLQESELKAYREWYPRVQPHLLNTDSPRGMSHAKYGVERKMLRDHLFLQVKGTPNTTVTAQVRILK